MLPSTVPYGLSEVYLGNAKKALNLPRREIVVMTEVCGRYSVSIPMHSRY